MIRMFHSLAWGLVLVVASTASLYGQESADLELPAHPGMWINSPPVSLEALKGKGVVLYFFEENCPRCTGKWPELAQISKQFADKPVVFLAVSSGTQRGEMEQYARRSQVPWPIILDPTREIERQANVGEISLQNITQYRYITADGKMHAGDWGNVPGTVEKALAGAAWRVEPTGIPPMLRPAWEAIELGNFMAAAPLIKKASADRKPEVKAAAEKLQEAVQKELDKEIATVKEGDKWQTYKTLRSIAERYKGFDLPDETKEQGRTLHADPDVKKELAAMEALEVIKKGLLSTSPLGRKRSFEKLDKFITDHEGTEAAEEASKIKEQAATT